MIISKSPYLWLSVSLTLCVLAVGFIPQLFPDSAVSAENFAERNEIVLVDKPVLTENETPQKTTEPMARKVYKTVDQMPIFAGKKCGDIMKYAKRKQCADQAMLDYIYQAVRYPKKARDKGVEGIAVVTFVVEAHGAISNIKLVRDPGSGTGKAAMKVVQQMKKEGLRFEPGLRKGKPVAVEFALPVKFKLE